MKKIVFLFFFSITTFSQVGIGTVNPNTTTMLDVTANDKGILIPRLNNAQLNAIVSPPQSLIVYNTDVNLYYYYSTANNAWMPINVGSIINSNVTSYTLAAIDNGRIIDFTSATTVTVTVPNTLPVGFQVSITQAGTGSVAFVGSGGMVINNRYSGTQTSGQWSKIGIEVRAINSVILSGDVK